MLRFYLVLLIFLIIITSAMADELLPDPAYDPLVSGKNQKIILAGGSFWTVQGVFEHVKGVKRALSGYAGGDRTTARYEFVGSGRTKHAEAVEVIYDPNIVSLGKLLKIYFSVAHDPTQLDGQGVDVGRQFRSVVFIDDAKKKEVVRRYIDQLNLLKIFQKPIVTKIESGYTFYPAEGYHQDYSVIYANKPYVIDFILPKIKALKALYPELYNSEPVQTPDLQM